MDLPDGWESKPPIAKAAKQYAVYPDLNAYFQLVPEPKSDFKDFRSWAAAVRRVQADRSKLENRSETALKEGRAGGRPTLEYEVTGEVKGVKLHYRMILVEAGSHYCNLVCWTTPSHWDEAQPKFEELVARLK